MKQLTCEMCGSTDLIKQEGVFVCQSCGCKYSVDEAKKMMVEGTVQVQGTVQIDKSEKFTNLYQMARNALCDRNFNDAYAYSSEAMIINADHAELIGIQALAFLGKEPITNSIPTSCVNTMSRMFKVLESSHDSADEKFRILSNIAKYMGIVYKVKKDHFQEERKELLSQMLAYSASSEKMAAANLAIQNFSGNIFTQQKAENNLEKERAKRLHNDKLDAQIRKIHEKEKLLENYQRDLNARIDFVKQWIRDQEYWKDHAEERKSMESKIAAYTSEIDSLRKQISDLEREKQTISVHTSTVPAQDELSVVRKTMYDLENKRSNLSIFKAKEKKAIQNELEKLLDRQKFLAEEVKKQRSEQNAKLNQKLEAITMKMEPLGKRILHLEKEKKEIVSELNKAR